MISTILNYQKDTKYYVSIVTGVKITDEQKQFLEDNSINFSKLVRKYIDSLMEKNN
jgi:hypothetical protein